MFKFITTKLGMMVLVLSIVMLGPHRGHAGDLKIHTVAVHGDAHVVETPGGKTMLIDAGSPWHVDRLKRYLDDLGIVKIDVIYLTHAHKDHFGGFTGENGILANYHVSEFYGIDEANSKAVFNNLILPHSLNQDLRYQVIRQGDFIEVDRHLEIKILYPPDPYPEVGLNEGSGACMITDLRNGRKFLYMADGMSHQKRKLVEAYGEDLTSDVLKYGHHTQFGLDDNYSMATFMEVVQPKYGIITKHQMPTSEPGHGELTQASFGKLYDYTWGSDSGLKSFMLGTHGHILVESTEDGRIDITTSQEYTPAVVTASEEPGIKTTAFTLTLSLSEPLHENRYAKERRGYYSLDEGETWQSFVYPNIQLDIDKSTTVMIKARDMYGNSTAVQRLDYIFE